MRTLIVYSLALASTVAPAFSAPMSFDQAARRPCREFISAFSSPKLADWQDPIADRAIKDGVLDGSTCNIVDLVRAECRLHPQFKVGQAIGSLYGKQWSHSALPSIPQCGA
jgi:hypothetical protein